MRASGRARLTSWAGCATLAAMPTPPDARTIADRQLVAYNALDLDAYCALFHEEAELILLPSQEVIARGRDKIREIYAARFATPGLRCVVHERSALGRVAIDRETVHMDDKDPLEILALYEIEDGLIVRAFFLRGV